jgi:pimeloyl-ACP methyl ester carboxylesterase
VVDAGPFRERDVRAPDGRTLRVAEYGSADGFPVVYCHGTPGSRLDHVPDPAVYEGFRLVAYDRPGYGGSDPDPGRAVAAAAGDAAAVADALALGAFSVFGVSGGGPHALGCAALLPDRVLRVAVRCGVAPFDDPDFDALAGIADVNVQEVTQARAGEAAIAGLLEPFAAGVAQDPDGVIAEMTREVPEVDKRHLALPAVRAVIRRSMTEAVRQGARGWIDDDLAFVAPWGFDLAAVRPEARLWQGELDVLVPRSHGEYLAGKLPQARFELVEGYGHWMHEHVPAALRWLAGSD